MTVGVLHIRIVTGSGGGPDKTILNSPRHLEDRGYATTCAFLRPPGDPGFAVLEEHGERWGAEIVAIDDRGALDLSPWRELEQLCRERAIQIVHTHDYKSNLIGLWLRRRLGAHLVSTVHGWVQMSPKLRAFYVMDRRLLRRYEVVACVSPDLVQACRKAGVPADRLHLLPNAVDTDDYRRTDPRRRADGPLAIVALGRLSTEKGFDVLIRSVAALTAHGVEVELTLAGAGPLLAELEQLVDELELGGQVTFVGQVSDPRPLLESADVLVSSSYREGLPNAILEGMAYELPVVATRVGGVAELVEDGSTGFLVDPGDQGGLVAAIQTLAEDEELRARFGKRGRVAVESSRSFSNRMERVAALYEQVLGRT